MSKLVMHFYLSVFCLGTILPLSAEATLSSFIKWEGNRKVLCETLLSPRLANLATANIRKSLFQRRAFSVDVASPVTNAAYDKLRLDPKVIRRETYPIFLKMGVNESTWIYPLEIVLSKKMHKKLTPIARIPLPDTRPTIWRTLLLDPSDTKLDYKKLIEEFPVSENQIEDQDGVIFGYHTDVDVDVVRTYISIDKRRGSTLGIDVPCDEIDKYLAGPAFTHHVITPWMEFCRVEILRFK